MGEMLPVWIDGLYNPADVMTKPIDKATTEQHQRYLSGQDEIPLPEDTRVWFGPPDAPELRGNKISPPLNRKSSATFANTRDRGLHTILRRRTR